MSDDSQRHGATFPKPQGIEPPNSGAVHLLIAAECLHRINTGRTPRRKVSCDECDAKQNSAAERLVGDYVSADFFKILGIRPVLRTLFDRHEEERGAPNVAIITDGLPAVFQSKTGLT